ncbi:MAG TPA: AraC family transcriptional regulator [Clostridia bacterium]|nr:AraC family transcriptional regulator [Clostridia bacterium]
MDWLDRMNGAMDYIEGHLASDINYEEAARIACCSTYHFQRMFSFITDVPLSEYIRRRRLTLAAFELQEKSTKVIDIALKYGYDSPNSFARAFQSLHGVTPSSARDSGVQLKAYPRMSFHITIKGDVEMDYRIEQKGAFRVYGVETIIDATDENNFMEIPDFWRKCTQNGTIRMLSEVEAPVGQNGLCKLNSVLCYRNTGGNTFPYMIGLVDLDNEIKAPDGLAAADIPACTWAIFRSEEHGFEDLSEKVQTVWKRVFPEWFPTSGYEHAGSAELEMTYSIGGGRLYTEVWIPVVKK